MSIQDHRRSDGICIWDHQWWPCDTARALTEAAEMIRNEVACDDPDQPATRGVMWAADLIDPNKEQS